MKDAHNNIPSISKHNKKQEAQMARYIETLVHNVHDSRTYLTVSFEEQGRLQ